MAELPRSDHQVALDETVAAARARWPGLIFSEADLARELAERGREVPPFGVELVLALACLRRDPVGLRALEREMFTRVDRVLGRLGLTGADADDVKQDVRTKLVVAEKVALYHGTGPLAHWIASVAGRDALMALRRKKPHEAVDDEALLDDEDDPELIALKARHNTDFKAAFQAALAALEPRDRAILRALVVDNRTVNEVAAVYGIHRVTASRRIADIRQALLDGTRRALADRLALDASTLDSALRMIDSQLDLSLHRLLADAA